MPDNFMPISGGQFRGIVLDKNGQEIEGGTGSLPSQTGHSGEFLTTDGTNASWGIPPGAVSYADNETPSGAIDGSNITFILAHTPTVGSLHLVKNGVEIYATDDYGLSGTTITLLVALQAAFQTNPADKLRATYRY